MKRHFQKVLYLCLACAAVGAGFFLGREWRGAVPAAHAQVAATESVSARDSTDAAPSLPPNSRRHSIVVDVAREVSPAVVTISTTVLERTYAPFGSFDGLLLRDPVFRSLLPGEMRERERPYIGSGFVVSAADLARFEVGRNAGDFEVDPKARYVLTNYHVIEGARKIFATLQDGREFPARLLDADRYVDVALLKLEAENPDDVPTVTLGDSDGILIGESVVALGNPFGPLIDDPHPTVTVGVVSAVKRSFQMDAQRRGGAPRIYRDMIQTDASVNPGNSGGPLVNMDGEVIGINTFIIAPGGGSSGVNFAIPIDRAVRVAREILQYGAVRSIAVDFDVVEVNPRLVQRFGLPVDRGLLIWRLYEGGPAEEAGLQLGDVIVKINDGVVEEEEDLIGEIFSRTAGERVVFTVVRGEERREIEYTIQAWKSE